MRYRTPGTSPGAPAVRSRGSSDARPARFTRRTRVLAALAAFVVGAAVALLVTSGAPVKQPSSHPVAAPTAARPSGSTRSTAADQPPALPLVEQPNWSTLSNPASGLSYQIPPTDWSTSPVLGNVGSVTLAQGAERTAYVCGRPTERLFRGILGSGTAPRADPTGVADAVASAAATLYYTTDNQPPTVTVGPAQPVRRRSGSDTLPGVLVRAVATQHTDPCLGTQGEVLVLVLRFPDHDGVLVVNGDIAGGPANPAPATDAELRAIVSTAEPTN